MTSLPQIKSAVPMSLLDRTKSVLTVLNLHFAGAALLGLVNLYLLIHMAFAWSAAQGQDASAVAQQTTQMHESERAAQPLRGLDAKLTEATVSSDDFYRSRLPYADSQVIGELGALTKKQGVKLSRVSLSYEPRLEGAVGALTEVHMDASLTGDYRPLVVFINSLERDKMFFVITGVSLTGQQSGTVNLRLKLGTYLRPPIGNEALVKTVSTPTANAAPASEVTR
jgi:type IV pilus assembly protein PilO